MALTSRATTTYATINTPVPSYMIATISVYQLAGDVGSLSLLCVLSTCEFTFFD